MKKTLLTAGLFCISLIANAQCTATATLNETFENFADGATGGLPQNCWTSSDAYPRAGVVAADGNKSLQFYTFMNPSVSMYLVSPELSTINGGDYVLSFNIGAPSVPGVIKLQVGTLASPTDFANFTPVGTEITVMAASTRSNIAIPASTTQKYIAFRVNSGNVPHAATTIDNIQWTSSLSVNDSKLASFNVYPNPSADRNITISHDGNVSEKSNIAVYSLTGTKVFETEIATDSSSKNVNLSNLAAGIYIMKLQSGENTTSKKLILK